VYVSHRKLFIRLHHYGVRGTVLTWLQNFFSNRTHQTRVECSLSDVFKLMNGVVQGSGIAPLMFLTYINELIIILEEYGIIVKAFADDVKLYLQIVNSVDFLTMQQALDALQSWASIWQLTISVKKCCILNIGSTVHFPSLSLVNTVLPINSSVLDLGINININLSPPECVLYYC